MNIKLSWTIAYLAMFTVLLSLGAWQIHRADEKQVYIDLQAQRINEHIDLTSTQTSVDVKQDRYKQASLTGHFDTTQQFLLDNQIHESKVGYFVMTPFKIKNTNKAILVNRGWIPLIEPRAILPDVTFQPESNDVTVTGRINTFPSVGIQLEGATQPTQTQPAVVQVLDDTVLSKKLGYDLLNFQLELSSDAPHGYVRNWSIVTVIPPEKHLAYALQWFGLALVLTVMFIKMALKK
jgi:surfeit locus 1 family protein